MQHACGEMYFGRSFKRRRNTGSIASDILECRRLLSSYTFSAIPFDATDGANPQSGVVADAQGDLFGTAGNGGADGDGTVFEIAHGTKTISIVASFDGTDGKSPQTPVTLDSNGDIFGTTALGGANSDGSVFEIVHGTNTITTLASFDSTDGLQPQGGVILDANGDLFGTAGGGPNDDGVVYEIAQGSGTINDISLFDTNDGDEPTGELLDNNGDLIGTGQSGGYIGNVFTDQGVVFETGLAGGGISDLGTFDFDGSTGSTPEGNIVMDSAGDIFGVTERTSQVSTTDGTVFEIPAGTNTITTVASFNGSNGEHPEFGLSIDSSGDLFGTTNGDGLMDGIYGTAFEIVHGTNTITTLHTFDGTDGLQPTSSLYMDSSGNLYGTVLGGGPNNDEPGGDGEVFELSPTVTPTQLAIPAAPSGAVTGTTISPPVTVAVEDANGNIVATDNSNVTLKLNGGGTLGGTTTVAAVNGIATFSDLTISAAGSNDTLTATDGSLTAATSATFAVTKSGGGGGGGGGGGTVTGVTPTILSSTVPASVVGGAKLHGALKISLDNTGSATEAGYSVNVYASTDTTLDTTADTLVTSVPKTPVLKAGKKATLSIPITELSASLDGSYYLIVETVDSADNTASADTSTPTVVAPPFVSLSETLTTTLPAALVSGTTAKGTVTVTITNNGNVASKGVTPIDVTASEISGVLGTSITTSSKTLNILPGKSIKELIQIKSIPALADGSYFLVEQTTDPFAAGTSLASSGTAITIAAPFITLVGTLGPANTKTGDTLTVTNNGNVPDNIIGLSGTLGFSTDAAGLVAAGSTISGTVHSPHILAGKSVKIHLTAWKSILSSLETGVPYYLTVRFTDATGNSGFAVSSTSFTLS